ncbi:hypothetical protein [Pararhodobacter marinus]|uniref:Peptidase S50 domain-containing protein n=1 Tax=Pararhodobacter marinus TaxID=2184063 RepID=A0A2U2C4G1_9RHOB|nr:hypothetical protein [Pararhodobacter marinus]PWE26752.1 hypothetical protein C4N9_20145 [Pararhodobacter marinus]
MTRTALALATLLTLTLNGSIAVASTPPAPCNSEGVCALSLRMLQAPPARPDTLVIPQTPERA